MKGSFLKKNRGVILFFILCYVFWIGMQDAAIKDKKGVVVYLDGSAKKQKLEEDNWRSIEANSVVVSGERVRTLIDSRAELEMAQLDIIRMAPKTTIDILKLYEETKDQVREAKIVLQSGDLWANITKKDEKMVFSINTPVAAAAITGTTLRLNVSQDSTSEVRVYSGEVLLSRAKEEKTQRIKTLHPIEIDGPKVIEGPKEVTLEQWTLIVKSMQKVKIDKEGKIIQSGSFSTKDQDEQTEWIQWNQSRDSLRKR